MRCLILKYIFVFLIGFIGYPAIEILWRGHTHITMAFAGGICFLIIYLISLNLTQITIIEKALIGALAITLVELVFGYIFNIVLKLNVWDYSAMPLNFHGQICLDYFLLWTGLCLLLFPFCNILDKYIFI